MSETSTDGTAAVAVGDLRYFYKRTPALQGVTFSVSRGSIHGFVGPNGAGKTTTLKILATLLKPQNGWVAIFGLDVRRHYKDVRRRIGYMPDHFGLYRQMTPHECLDFFGAAYGIPRRRRDVVIDDLLALTDMEGRKNDLVSNLSRGMMQRLSLARALVHDPDLLLLDEPASGLDPRARLELLGILRELRKMGKTIFISSHILGELAGLCDCVTIIDRGLIRYSGTMTELLLQRGETSAYILRVQTDTEGLEETLGAVEGVTEVTKMDEQFRYRIKFNNQQTDTGAVLRAIIDAGARVASFREDTRELSHAFLELTTPGVP